MRFIPIVRKLRRCLVCGNKSVIISDNLGVCITCLRKRPEESLKITDQVHKETRGMFGLPSKPPTNSAGIMCGMCLNACQIGSGEKGYCGLVSNIDGHLVRMGGTPEKGILEWYYDPLPTNCVAWWFCPGCVGAGYPEYAYRSDAERGHSNLAVFYGACSFDCLFCQNWHYRRLSQECSPVLNAANLAEKVDEHVSCICFFGGDPSVQMPHALRTSEIALERAQNTNRILRICWETNGYMLREFAEKASEISLRSGGVIKFDLKTWDDNINRALCGVSNKPAFENFKAIGKKYFKTRSAVPVLTASTLLIPGYVDAEEVERISGFIADIDHGIPYTLLAFYPHYQLIDLPTTSRKQAKDCQAVAEKHLQKVKIGNIHLLS